MTVPRLSGPRVSLVPLPHAVAVAVVRGEDPPLAPLGLRAAPGWPHAGTADAVRPYAEHGDPGSPDPAWLVVVDGEVVGDCGWAGPADDRGDCEVGYGLAAGARRQGLGTEAVGLLAAWTELQPGVRRVVAEVLQGNEASLRLLRRLGFAPTAGAVQPYVRMARLAPSAVPARGQVTGRHVC